MENPLYEQRPPDTIELPPDETEEARAVAEARTDPLTDYEIEEGCRLGVEIDTENDFDNGLGSETLEEGLNNPNETRVYWPKEEQ